MERRTTHLHVDASETVSLAAFLRSIGTRAPVAIRRAVNRTGDMARTAVRRSLVKQTGLSRRVIVKAVKVTRATGSDMRYLLRSRGGDVSLKYFGPRETRRGLSARPWGSRKVFAGVFTHGGRFPRRVALKMNGHGFKRVGSSRKPIQKQKSGLFIPTEMITGATAAGFNQIVQSVLPARVRHEVGTILNGYTRGRSGGARGRS